MAKKICTKCKKSLLATQKYFYRQERGKYGLKAECKNCQQKRHNNWCKNNPDKVKKQNKRKYQKNSKKYIERAKNWQNAHPGSSAKNSKKYREEHPFKNCVQKRRWHVNNIEKVRISSKKSRAKRRRALGFELLFDNPFSNNILVDYHHISDGFVVAIPKSLHLNHLGKNHREELKPFIESIYNISYLLEG